MSNYSVTPINPKHQIMAGWNPMLSTFFVHVIDTTKEEDDTERDVMWVGTSVGEITDVNVIVMRLIPFAEYDGGELERKLYEDAHS